MKRTVVLSIFVLAVSLYVATFVFLFSMPRSVESLTYRLQVTLSYYFWPDSPIGNQEVLGSKHDFGRINGSAVAISSSGDLLTDRHVIDSNFYLPWPCGEWLQIIDGKEVKMNVQIESFDLVVTAPNGRQWHGTAYPENPNGPWCDEQNHMRFKWDPKSDAVIVAMDDVHDLALVSIKVSSPIPYARLQRGQAIAGKDVKICGFPKGNVGMKVYSGMVMTPCTIVNENNILKSLPVIHVTPRAEHGMSGGPIVVGNRLVGTVLSPEGKHQTIGVPGFYITKWLDWVNGRTLKPPEPVCSP
jgi:S1-C subfamily serine protease